MGHDALAYRMYGDLAAWWPLISPPERYAEEAAFTTRVIQSAAIPVGEVLELGSGGGHSASHLKANFDMTLVDLSEDMLEMSKRLNPECRHEQGDMRTVRLGRSFDAIFVHDAIEYMVTESDLASAMATAFVHCRPGGITIMEPDHTAETFEESRGQDGSDSDDGRRVRYHEWTRDPDPSDTWIETDYTFEFRHADGSVNTVHETHRTGLFPNAVWERLLSEAGFETAMVTEKTSENRPPRVFFVGHRQPAG